MGEVSQILGRPISLVLGDKQYNLSPLTDNIRAEYESISETAAIVNVQKQRAILGDDYLPMLARVNSDIVAGVYDFGGPMFVAMVNSFPGLLFMFWLMCKANHPGLTLDEVKWLGLTHASEIKLAVERALGQDKPDTTSKKNEPPNQSDISTS